MLTDFSYKKMIQALFRFGFRIKRQSKHVVLSNETGEIIIIPRSNKISPIIIEKIVKKQLKITYEEFTQGEKNGNNRNNENNENNKNIKIDNNNTIGNFVKIPCGI